MLLWELIKQCVYGTWQNAGIIIVSLTATTKGHYLVLESQTAGELDIHPWAVSHKTDALKTGQCVEELDSSKL